MDDQVPPRRIDASELFGNADAIVIQHNDASYELRITRRKRLILTKADERVLLAGDASDGTSDPPTIPSHD